MRKLSVQNSYPISSIVMSILILAALKVNAQLPEDIQRELNQNLAEQARQQQLQQQINQLQQQQQQQQQRQAAARQPPAAGSRSGQTGQDPNNYSFNQVAPPVQYSYYRPYGDNQPQQQQPQQVAPQQNYYNNQPQQYQPQQYQQQQQVQQQQNLPFGNDFNGFGFNQAPQAQVQPQQPVNNYYGQQPQQQAPPVPNFNGAGGLPVLQNGQLPTQQQHGGAPVQQGPPLTENDFKDITEGQNYGAPGGSDFGLGNVAQNGGQSTGSNTDAQLREFGLPADPNAASQTGAGGNSNIPNLGPLDANGGGGLQIPGLDNLGGGQPGVGGGSGGGGIGLPGDAPSGSPIGQGGLFGPQQQPSVGSFEANPLSSSSNGNGRSAAPVDDGAINISDLGERSDQFAGNNLPGLGDGQPTGSSSDSDFNYASPSHQKPAPSDLKPAPSDQQPELVPYPDEAPQPVGSLFAVTQPQSLTQTRYNPLPDKGTYQDYPAYHLGADNFDTVSDVVERTPPARAPGLGRYSSPSPTD